MAIVQISRITNRKGLQENLPQLAGAEFGWAVDSRRLFIGNGTLQEGAPVVGNTEILTQYSDITVLSNYTYEDIIVGYAAETGPDANQPVVRSLQARLDDFVSVRAFGAQGDGETDDTAAINRALFQLYCRDPNPLTRRSLFFPAGVYRVTETIVIPTYAKLMGEGADCSIIVLDTRDSSLPEFVARTGDSLQQTGVAMGTNGAVMPRDIEISSLTFRTLENSDVFFVEATNNCWFSRVYFESNVTVDDLLDTGFNPAVTNITGLTFASLPAGTAIPGTVCENIVMDSCGFYGMTYGINSVQLAQSVTVTNSDFNTLYQGIVLGGLATGFRAVHNSFDLVFAEGIVFGDISLNVSAYNIFYNVGQNIGSESAVTAVIRFGNDNNISVGDLFQRSYQQTVLVPAIEIVSGGTPTGTTQMRLGRYARQNGVTQSLAASVTNGNVVTVNSTDVTAFDLDYVLIRSNGGGSAVRKGRMTVVRNAADDSSDSSSFTFTNWSDDYTENISTGVILTAEQSGENITIKYSTTAGSTATMYYSLNYLA